MQDISILLVTLREVGCDALLITAYTPAIPPPTRTHQEQTVNLSLIGSRLVYEHVPTAFAQTPHSAATHVDIQVDVVLEQIAKRDWAH
jgi:hypothetical protein